MSQVGTLEGILHFKDDRSDGQLRDPLHPLRDLPAEFPDDRLGEAAAPLDNSWGDLDDTNGGQSTQNLCLRKPMHQM